ncbi:MAG: cAMP-activated global transcriptional regulator CRP [Gammaproteobacteria bacterium]|nr:cAMP-activated global transcriptional regulator CRP [Gammaproteobacteria bacterium]NNC97617.1 cAMP-activated global transcriptional regulator CRP [Gammaproteobacteria bacterium]NNM14197.1 cAMP-activated global transcriptional regulator CRP [Gammaproteobacteria bacterium]
MSSPQEFIQVFIDKSRQRELPNKAVVIHAGDVPDSLFYILEGSVEVLIEDKDGNEIVLSYLNKGDFLGEMGLFEDRGERSAWVRTRTKVVLAEMTYPRFRELVKEHPEILFELANQLSNRLNKTNIKLGNLAFVDVAGRIAYTLMDLCLQPDALTHPDGMQIKVSRTELSRLVGCSREMAGRVLKILEEEGLVEVSGKTIVVHNVRPGETIVLRKT